MRHGRCKFMVYRELQDGYTWRLRSASGETLGSPSQGHGDKHSCYEEIRSVMTENPDADILDVAVG